MPKKRKKKPLSLGEQIKLALDLRPDGLVNFYREYINPKTDLNPQRLSNRDKALLRHDSFVDITKYQIEKEGCETLKPIDTNSYDSNITFPDAPYLIYIKHPATIKPKIILADRLDKMQHPNEKIPSLCKLYKLRRDLGVNGYLPGTLGRKKPIVELLGKDWIKTFPKYEDEDLKTKLLNNPFLIKHNINHKNCGRHMKRLSSFGKLTHMPDYFRWLPVSSTHIGIIGELKKSFLLNKIVYLQYINQNTWRLWEYCELIKHNYGKEYFHFVYPYKARTSEKWRLGEFKIKNG